MDDIANLGIRIDSRSVRTADKDLDKLTRASSRAEKATDSLKRGYAAATASILAGAAAFAGTANKLVQVERQTGILVSSLRTVTGSAAGAKDAFDALQSLAGRLPVSIPEITDAFIKMKALGLNPTEAALVSFTNTASAMGKNLNQFVEAVADAATGEFERLKEFGIKASQSAEGVAFTFQGVTTRVGKNASEITAYLQKIGEVEFAGAAAARMAELDGQISNLSDSWDSLFRTINEKGAAKVISDSVGLATDAIQELTAFIGSGQLELALDNIGLMFTESFDISKVSDELITEFGTTFDAINYAGGETVTFLIEAFAKWPRNVAAITKIIGTEIANLVALGELYGEKLAYSLDPKNWFNDEPTEKLEAAQNRLARKTDELNRALANGAIEAAPAIIKLREQIDELTREQETLTNEIETGSGKLAEFAAQEQTLADIRLQGIDEALTGLEAGLALDEKRASMLDVLRQKYDEQKASVKSLDDVLKGIPKSTDAIATGVVKATTVVTDRVEQVAAAVTDLGAGAKPAAKEIEVEFDKTAVHISDSLQDAITQGDWAGLGASVAGAFAGGIGGVVATQLAQQFAGSAGAIIGPIGGAIAGGLIGLAANAVADFFRDDWDPTEALQATQGTGTVLGSIEAKSESIRNATEAIEKTNADLVNINTSMLAALKSVQQGISGATAMIAGGRAGVGFSAPAVDANFFSSGPVGGAAGGLAGGALAGLLTGGIGSALGGIGGMLGSAASGFMDTITFGLFGKLGEALGGKSRQVDEGIDIIGGTLADLIDNTVVSAFATFRTKKNAFSSTKTSEQSRLLGDEISNQFGQVFNDILGSVVAGGAALGIDQASLEAQLSGFVVETQRLSLEGLDAAAQQAEIAAVFGKLFDDLVMTAVPFLGDFQRAGEGLGETLARVSTEVALTKEAAAALGFAFAGAITPVELVAAAADDLVMMTGGIEAFSNAMRTFEGAFLSTEEQTALASRRLTEALGELPLPETREGFKALLQGQDALTESGRQNIATLLTLAGTADKYYTALETASEKAAEDAKRAADIAEAENKQRIADAERAAEQLTAAIGSFIGSFAPEAYKFEVLTSSITTALGAVGVALPETREGMWALAAGLDGTTEAGKAAIEAIARATGDLNAYYTTIETSAKTAADTTKQEAADAKKVIADIFAELQRVADTALSNLRASVNAQIAVVEKQRKGYEDGLANATNTTDDLMGQLTGIVDAQRDAAATKLQVEQDAINAELNARTTAAANRLASQKDAIAAELEARLEANGLMLDAAKMLVSDVRRELDGIGGALKGLAADISPEGVRAQALATLRKAAVTGDLTGTGEAAGIATNIDTNQFSTLTDLRRVQGTTAALLTQLEGVGTKQLSDAEQTVAILTAQNDVIRVSSDAQVAAAERGASRTVATAEAVAKTRLDAAQEQHDTEVERLDKLLTDAQTYIDVSRGIAAGVATVDEAIRLGLASLKLEAENRGALEQGKFDEQIDSLNAIYDTAQAQLDALRGINAGIRDISTAQREFETAVNAEATAVVPADAPGFASGGDFGGGARVVGERGPELEFTGPSRIVDSNSFKQMLANNDMRAELTALRNDLNMAMITLAKNTGKTARQLERWDLDGLPEERVFA